MKSGKTRNALRAGAVWIAIMLFGGVLVSPPQAAPPWKLSSVSLSGVDGANNNITFAYDRYILVAPYAPSKMPTDASAFDQLDNFSIYLIDPKRPANDNILSHTLETAADHRRLYYPTKVVFDEASKTVYVRGTRYEPVADGVQEIAVLAYMHLNLDDSGKPAFDDNLVMIDIAGVGAEKTINDAPDDFALAYGGDMVAFTNGASIFTYNLDHGYLYNVDIVDPKAFSAGGRISYLDVDPQTNILTVYWNGQTGAGGKVKNFSELSFYNLDKNGTMQLKKRLHPEQFPGDVYITPGSNVEILVGEKSMTAWLVTSDGMLSQMSLTGDEIYSPLKPFYQFDGMAAGGGDSSPRLIKYDAAKRTVGVVRQGYTAQIRKPINDRRGKPGSVIRSLSLFNAGESPALAVGRLNKNANKVIASKLYADDYFRGEDGLTRLIDGADSQWLLATRSGKVLALNASGPVDDGLNVLTQVGPRTGRIAYFNSRDSIVAINSFSLDPNDQQISESGALVVARQSAAGTQSYGVASAATVSSGRQARVSNPTPAIRRPCNIK